jgi:hypothetical protein
LYPAYLPSLTEQGLLLKPTWVVELSNGATRVLSLEAVEKAGADVEEADETDEAGDGSSTAAISAPMG